MTHSEHVHLIKKTFTATGGVWADLGSGDGAFTLALRDLAGETVEIFSIDKDKNRLQNQEQEFNRMFPQSNIHFINQDFTKDLELPLLDGILMANSLHYVKNQSEFLRSIQSYLKPQGKLVIVEYNTDEGNYWVPFPLSFPNLRSLAESVGFHSVQLLEKVPSSYWNEMYAAEGVKA